MSKHSGSEPNAATMLVVISPGLTAATQSFPNPLMLKPGAHCAWHCNSPSLEHDKTSGFLVTFDDPRVFGTTEVSGPIGGRTPALIVQDDAPAGSYAYHIMVLGTNHDPEIIIEEAVPTEPELKTRAAGTSR